MAKYIIVKVEDEGPADISFHIDTKLRLNLFIVLFLFSSIFLALGIYILASPYSILQEYLHNTIPNYNSALLGGLLSIIFGALELYLLYSLLCAFMRRDGKGKNLRPSLVLICTLIAILVGSGFAIHKSTILNSKLQITESDRAIKFKESTGISTMSSEFNSDRWSNMKDKSYEMGVIQCWSMNAYKQNFANTELNIEIQDDGLIIACLLNSSIDKDNVRFVNGDFSVYLPSENRWIRIPRYDNSLNEPRYQHLDSHGTHFNNGTTLYDAIRHSADFKMRVPTSIGELEFNFKGLGHT